MFMFNNYFIIIMFRKDNDISFIYLIFKKKILSAKIIEINVALF